MARLPQQYLFLVRIFFVNKERSKHVPTVDQFNLLLVHNLLCPPLCRQLTDAGSYL